MKNFIVFGAAIVSGVILISCGSSSSNNYGGPGSDWRANIEGSTFTITRAADVAATRAENFGLTITGSAEVLESGFQFLTVESVTGDDGPTAGDTAYGLEVPGFAFMLKPAGSDEIIPMVEMGNCPTTDLALNWVVTNSDSPNKQDVDTFGVFTFTESTGAALISGGYSLNDGFGVQNEFTESNVTGTCNQGILDITGNDSATIYLNGSGGALVDTGSSVIVAMPRTEVTAANLDGNYFGIEFFGNGTEDSTFPVSASVSDSGATITITRYSDVENATLSETVHTLSGMTYNAAGATTLDGFATGSLDHSAVTADANISCNVTEDAAGSGKNLIFCRSYDADDTPTEENPGDAISFLLRQR